jgi:hypothetical protein
LEEREEETVANVGEAQDVAGPSRETETNADENRRLTEKQKQKKKVNK